MIFALFQRGLTSVKTLVVPRPLSSMLVDTPTISAPLDLGELPQLSLDIGPLSPTGSVQEQGAKGMLQVMGPPSLVSCKYFSLNIYYKSYHPIQLTITLPPNTT